MVSWVPLLLLFNLRLRGARTVGRRLTSTLCGVLINEACVNTILLPKNLPLMQRIVGGHV